MILIHYFYWVKINIASKPLQIDCCKRPVASTCYAPHIAKAKVTNIVSQAAFKANISLGTSDIPCYCNGQIATVYLQRFTCKGILVMAIFI